MKLFNTFMAKEKGSYIRKPVPSKVLMGVLAVTFCFFTFLSFKAFSKPVVVQEKFQDNLIKQSFSYSLKANVVPCTLYPKGGIISPEGSIVSKVTKALVIDMDAMVTAQKPVVVDASKKITVSLAGDSMWESKYLEKNIDYKGKESTTNDLLKDKLTISLVNINNFINKVQGELDYTPSRYLIKIKPELKGTVTSGDTVLPLELSNEEITLEYYPNGQIQILKDDGNMDGSVQNIGNNTFNNEVPVYDTSSIRQKLNLFGIGIPLLAARCVFLPVALLFLVFFIVIYTNDMKEENKQITEAQRINKKYRSRIIPVQSELEAPEKVTIILESFKFLLRIADDRELTIHSLDSDENSTTYFIVDSGCIYKYLADNTFKADFKIYAPGSGFYNEQ